MKILTPTLIIIALLLSACNSSDDQMDVLLVDEQPVNIAQVKSEPVNKELIGKTVDEYQEIVNKQEKAKATSTPSPSKSETKTVNTTTGKQDSIALYDQEIEKGFLPLKWEGLIAPGYDADAILEKYSPVINTLAEGSDEANKLYEKMQAEYNKAPPNDFLANKNVSIPGFIAPLEQSNGVITEFLLVPYFGACIHQPAPPANQTVHVKTAPDAGIRAEEAYDPIWVSGELLIDKTTTDIGSASYQVKQARTQKYDMEN